LNYFFHPAAEAEHLESLAWFESRATGLGASYLDEFVLTMAAICDAPQRYPIVKSPDIQRVRMDRFPLSVLYREHDNEIEVLAVAHHRRRPHY